jgi:ABC-type transport system involved in multi-copper enzyme maturation permease subunit
MAGLARLFVVARLTLAETARRRLFLVLVVVTFVAVALSAWGFAQIAGFAPEGASPQQRAAALPVIVSQFLVLVTFMYSFILALGAAFLAGPIVASDIESGVAVAMLARPLRRSELLLGKWLGIALLVAFYAVGSGILELIAVQVTTGYVPPQPVLAVAFLVGQAVVLLTAATALATRLAAITSGVLALATFGLAWVGGIVGGIGVALANPSIAVVGDATRLLVPTDGLWRGAAFNLYPPIVIELYRNAGAGAAAFPFYVPDPVPTWYVAWAVLWIAVVLGAGLLSFRTRDL